MLIEKEDFLSLQVILMQKFFTRNYFLDWVSKSNNSTPVEECLLAIEQALANLDKEYSDLSIKPSEEYQNAIASIEYFPQNLADVLKHYAELDKILYIDLAHLKRINDEFHNHFISKLVSLKTVIIHNMTSNNHHNTPLSTLYAFDKIHSLKIELIEYFSKLPIADPTEYLLYFVQILNHSTYKNIEELSDFIQAHPMVTVILINHMKALKKTYKERMLFLKVTLTQTLDTDSYFFEWARSAGYFDKISLVLSPIEDKLGALDMFYPNRPISPSTEYQKALDDLETYPENLEAFFIKHKSIDAILTPHICHLKEINEAFHAHCAEKLLPLRTMLIQSTQHDSNFGKWIQQSVFSDHIRELSAELRIYFASRNERYREDEMRNPFIVTFVNALKSMENNPRDLIDFLNKNPSVTLIFTNYIKLLNIINISFSKHFDSQSDDISQPLCQSQAPLLVPHFNLTQSEKEKGKEEEKEEDVLANDFTEISL